MLRDVRLCSASHNRIAPQKHVKEFGSDAASILDGPVAVSWELGDRYSVLKSHRGVPISQDHMSDMHIYKAITHQLDHLQCVRISRT